MSTYRTMDDLRRELRQVKAERDMHAEALSAHWERVQDPELRGALVRNTLHDALRSWGPFRALQEVLQGRVTGGTISHVGHAVAATQGGFVSRSVIGLVSDMLARLVDREPVLRTEKMHRAAELIGQVVRGVRQRWAKREPVA